MTRSDTDYSAGGGPDADPVFTNPKHDHGHCLEDILASAGKLCARRGARLTKGRRRVLEIVAEGHRAIGAYEVLEKLAEEGARPAPMTVYRALDFLMAHGLVHRIESMNAYVACCAPAHEHAGAQFLICEKCGDVAEFGSDRVLEAIREEAKEAGFAVQTPVIEISGVCPNCAEARR